jgi:C-terminal processing protease CtpA/Prc
VSTRTSSPVAGNNLADKTVYVLTSSRTQSAAEYFAYNLKMLKRATLVGETTAGHQHSGAFRRVNDHFGMGIQESARPDNPYPVKGWEVIGVEPDVRTSRPEALRVARELAERRQSTR